MSCLPSRCRCPRIITLVGGRLPCKAQLLNPHNEPRRGLVQYVLSVMLAPALLVGGLTCLARGAGSCAGSSNVREITDKTLCIPCSSSRRHLLAVERPIAWIRRHNQVTRQIVRSVTLSEDTAHAEPNFENFATPIKRAPGRILEMAHAINDRSAALRRCPRPHLSQPISTAPGRADRPSRQGPCPASRARDGERRGGCPSRLESSPRIYLMRVLQVAKKGGCRPSRGRRGAGAADRISDSTASKAKRRDPAPA